MGRPYDGELRHFETTYHWAVQFDIRPFAEAVRRTQSLPLAVIGSGGSLSAAQFCADWHQRLSGRLARTLTPLEAVALRATLRDTAVALYSAGGRNADIRGAFASIVESDVAATWVLTATAKSPLQQAASEAGRRSAGRTTFVAAPTPAGRDGFLATNSLLGFVLLTHRAYLRAADGDTEADHTSTGSASTHLAERLPASWEGFADAGSVVDGAAVDEIARASTLVVLHGYTTRAAAIDLESKCTEAGLLTTQLADFRNFGHGRHHWLAKHPDAAVLALVAPEDEALANKTLALLPRRIRRAMLSVPYLGMLGAARALVDVMRLVAEIGRARGIDPGRPGVPSFGGKLYSLRGIDLVQPAALPLSAAESRPPQTDVTPLDTARRAPSTRRGTRTGPASRRRSVSADERAMVRAVERKLGAPLGARSLAEQTAWTAAYATARAALDAASIGAIVFDYDGTLVDVEDRFSSPRPEVLAALTELLTAGITIGIATGRGGSAGEALRGALPRRLWKHVVMGYYNGGELAPLADGGAPCTTRSLDTSLIAVRDTLDRTPEIAALADVTVRTPQITLRPRRPADAMRVWTVMEGALLRAGTSARIVRSSHSIDILAAGVSKLNVVRAVSAALSARSAPGVLRVGDRGAWPGNDAELLSTLEGVSVDEVSPDPQAAWNFSPPGVRGVPAVLALAEALRIFKRGHLQLRLLRE